MNESLPKYEEFLLHTRIVLGEHLPAADVLDILSVGLAIENPSTRVEFFQDVIDDLYATALSEEAKALSAREQFKQRPVGIREFVCSKDFLDKEEEVFPKLLDELEIMNNGQYVEIVYTGGIGSGKTTGALYTNAYQLYLLSCLHNPHKLYGLDPSSEILLIFQSITAALAARVDYARFKNMIEVSPYFQNHFPFDRNLKSSLVFAHRIEVRPVSGADTAAIGQNVMGGLIDELNYMAIVEESKLTKDKGTYDQALAVYNSISRRRKSRFMKQGKLPGVLCLVSSKKYPGQFTDQKEEEAREEIRKKGTTSIYIYDKRVWEIAPEDRFSGEWFDLFVGDESRKPRIIEEGDVVRDSEKHLVMKIPVEYRSEFERDMMNALRDIAGVSTIALFPFFQSREDVHGMFDAHDSILSETETDFISPQLLIFPKRFYKPDLPRWIHIDLSLSQDATGISCASVPGFAAISRGEGLDDYEMMPQIRFDFQLRVIPPKGGEILYHKIRSMIYSLKQQGLNVKWVSLDSYQSVDMQQILRQNGYVTGELSMDKTTLPYEFLKSACYDGRIMAPPNRDCAQELIELELDAKKKKIDHQPTGSKDVADSMAGCVYGLTMRREIWSMFDVSVIKLPITIQSLLEIERERMKEIGDYAGMVAQRFPEPAN